MTLTAAHPTVVIGLGDAAGAVYSLAHDLDDGFDLEEERGLRYLVEEGGQQRFGYVRSVSRESLVRGVRLALQDLASPIPSAVVPAEQGQRIIVTCGDHDLKRAGMTITALRDDAEIQELADAYKYRCGVQIRLVIASRQPGKMAKRWIDRQADDERLAQVTAIIVDGTRNGVRLTDHDHWAAVVTTLRTLALEATHDFERCDGDSPGLNLLNGRCRIWQVGELVDGSVTLADERKRQRFAEWVGGFVHHPRDSGAEVPTLPSLAAAQATRGNLPPLPLMARLEVGIDRLRAKANAVGSAVGREQSDPDLALQRTWPQDACSRLRGQLERDLLGGGRAESESWLRDVQDQLNADEDWLKQLHGRLDQCGSEPLIGALQGQLNRGQSVRDAATLAREPHGAPSLGGLEPKLATLQRTLIDTIGERPPTRWAHWMLMPWLAFGMLSTPIWQSLGRQFGPPNTVHHSPFELVAHTLAWYVGAQDQALVLGAVLGLAGWSLVWWLTRRRWRREIAAWREEVVDDIGAAVRTSGGILEFEISDLCHRARLARFEALESGIQRIRLRIADIRRTTKAASWLIRRMEGRRFALPTGDEWQVVAEAAEIRWRLLPPTQDGWHSDAGARPGGGRLRRSPWPLVDFKPSEPEAATDFFIHPNKALAYWERPETLDEISMMTQEASGTLVGLSACRPNRLTNYTIAGLAASLEVHVLKANPVIGRLAKLCDQDADAIPSRLGPDNTAEIARFGRQQDRIIVVQQVSLRRTNGGSR